MTLLTGCSGSKALSPREAFLARTTDRTAYAKLYEVSPESLRREEERIHRIIKGVVRGVREAKKEGRDIDKHLADVERGGELLHEERLGWISELEAGYDPKADVVLFYHYWPDDENQDFGFMVTRNGVVRKKFPSW